MMEIIEKLRLKIFFMMATNFIIMMSFYAFITFMGGCNDTSVANFTYGMAI